MKTFNYKKLSNKKLLEILRRPALNNSGVLEKARLIVNQVKKDGYKAVLNYAKIYDGVNSGSLILKQQEIKNAAKKIPKEIKKAIDVAYENIKKFHLKQLPQSYSLETMPGVLCSRKYIPIENVSLYIPGGSAVLVSTMLMLGIPAKIAGCKRVVVCTPIGTASLEPALAYAILKCGIKEVYSIGGAQAIAMMAYGTEKTKKVDKIFGPGNQFVTAAKTIISTDPDGCAIDMPAGPSEVLVIADNFSNPAFIAADLLSQAEHGSDSQVVLISTSSDIIKKVLDEIKIQIEDLPRKSIAEKCLQNSSAILVESIEQAIEISNIYAPEHLILQLKNAEKYSSKVINAGSVFIGSYSPESVGDYASGTNHSLPTYGYAKSFSGVSVDAFMKGVTFQKLTKKGLENISGSVIKLAETEKLQAHANAVKIRLNK